MSRNDTRKKNDKSAPIVKRVKRGKRDHHSGAWKIAYADFVTAMMALFMVLWLLTLVVAPIWWASIKGWKLELSSPTGPVLTWSSGLFCSVIACISQTL